MGNQARREAAVHGLLIVNKEAGPTSHDIVQRIRRCLKVRRVGHAWTLDPFAMGVLVVCVGDATRLSEYVMRGTKVYDAEVMFGIETETDDVTGEVVREMPMQVDEGAVRAALGAFIGEIDQTPPAYSAIKVDGEPLYKAARRGEQVAPETRRVRILDIQFVGMEMDPRPRARLTVTCEQGTYIRSLARDLGRALGGCATLSRLVRTKVGVFAVSDAVSSRRFIGPDAATVAVESLLSVGCAVADMPKALLTSGEARAFVLGNPAPFAEQASLDGMCEVSVWLEDLLLGVGRASDGFVRPRKVLSAARAALQVE